jgi:endonuclease G, mitochondrial
MKNTRLTLKAHALAFAVCALAATAPLAALANSSACPQHFASGPPQLINTKLQTKTRELCSEQFVVLHSGVTRTPIYSAERLTRATVGDAKEQVRYNNFHPDSRLPSDERAELRDYARSGFDRGHMAPSGNMPNITSQQESFALSNMIPQNADNNRYLWAGIESTARQIATRTSKLYVVSGAIFSGSQIRTVGGRVMVPTHLFKAMYNPQTNESAAYIVRNDDGRDYAIADMATIERLSGIRPFPGVQVLRPGRLTLPAPIGRGSNVSHYRLVSADDIMRTGSQSLGAARAEPTHPTHLAQNSYLASALNAASALKHFLPK